MKGKILRNVMILIVGMIALYGADATCSVCNETCSPCGGGCVRTDFASMFTNVVNFDATYGNISGWNTSCVTNMNSMFLGSRDFNQSLNNWDVSNVTNMFKMFYSTDNFNQPLNNWDTKKVTTMSQMFRDAKSFNQNINVWNTSKVTDMSSMFLDASAFNGNISSWDTHNVTDMSNMFNGAHAFNQNINSWNISKVTDISYMFKGATNFNQPLNNWDTSNVLYMFSAFSGATNFNQPLNSWDISKIDDTSEMFYGASSFNQSLSSWDTSNVIYMYDMFDSASAFDQNISMWNVSNVTDMSGMFLGITLSTPNYDSLLLGWSSRPVKPNVAFGAGGSRYSLEGLPGRSILTNATNNWAITDFFNPVCNICTEVCTPCGGGCTATDFSEMYRDKVNIDVTYGNISGWNTSCVTNMYGMFYHASGFNQNINSWDMSHVISITNMFNGVSGFNQPLNNWNTTNVLYMRDVFYNAISFNQDLSSWNVSRVTDMSGMFPYSNLSMANYNSILSGWSSRSVQPAVTLGVGSTKYSSAGLAGRNILTNLTNLWTIIDGGLFVNTPPNVSNVEIFNVSSDYNCSFIYNDFDSDPLNLSWFRWYIDGSLSGVTNQILGSGNISIGSNATCSVLVFDGFDNSTWYNSSLYLVGDFTSPALLNYSLSASTYNVGSDTVLTINASDNGHISSVKINLKKPTGASEIRQLSPLSGNTYVLTIDDGSIGDYNITSINITDGNNNRNDTAVGLLFSVFSLPLSVGGAGATSTIYVNITGNITINAKAIDDVYLHLHFDNTSSVWKRSIKTNLVMTSCSIGEGFNCSINQNEIILSKDFSNYNNITDFEKTDLTLVYGISAATIPVSLRIFNTGFYVNLPENQFMIEKLYIFPIIGLIVLCYSIFYKR